MPPPVSSSLSSSRSHQDDLILGATNAIEESIQFLHAVGGVSISDASQFTSHPCSDERNDDDNMQHESISSMGNCLEDEELMPIDESDNQQSVIDQSGQMFLGINCSHGGDPTERDNVSFIANRHSMHSIEKRGSGDEDEDVNYTFID